MTQKIGFIGLGRMGANMVSRILESGKIEVVAWNRSKEKIDEAVAKGAIGSESIQDLVGKLDNRKIVWLMLPSGDVTEKAFHELLDLLDKDDIVINGANTNFKDTMRHHSEAGQKGIQMLDVGVSGGIIAADKGYPMMIGGELDVYAYCKPIFESFGRKGGYDLVGPGGSGHFVKMVHNAIEYGMMQAIAEGFDLLDNGHMPNLDLHKISSIWNNGTIVESFLMQMVEKALENDNHLSDLKPFVDDTGEGKWAAEDAMEHGVPFIVNTTALHARYISRQENSTAFRMLAAMRKEFGGHAVKK